MSECSMAWRDRSKGSEARLPARAWSRVSWLLVLACWLCACDDRQLGRASGEAPDADAGDLAQDSTDPSPDADAPSDAADATADVDADAPSEDADLDAPDDAIDATDVDADAPSEDASDADDADDADDTDDADDGEVIDLTASDSESE